MEVCKYKGCIRYLENIRCCECVKFGYEIGVKVVDVVMNTLILVFFRFDFI
ncbi:hypothetical protein CWI37_1315p0010 [Hamiltosporidium tvaerminnensis]|uniref:Uncharacterized protein n=1 Tax=Hamiltosporidium tvaerminnensis TaxID=1176355 RepID=A0A4V2JUA8_9MICR|nr:hypothetical protein CWI37_1315p0010 [Hamiltosporidium tvaerminnensis]